MINISKIYCGLSGQSDHLRYNPQKTIGPVVVFNSTAACNLKCLHCYSSSTADTCKDQLTTEEAKNLISQLAEMNCPVILFSGGEPLLRTDLFELLEHAADCEIKTVLSTNGTLIDEDVAQKLAQVNMGYVGVSIDGVKETHDFFRNTAGAFENALRGIEDCRKAGIRTGIRFTINSHNADQIPELFEIAAQTQTRRICFYHLITSGRATDFDPMSLSADQTRNTIDTILEKTSEYVGLGLIEEVLTVGNHADGPYTLLKIRQKTDSGENNELYEKAQNLLLANGGNKVGENIACVSWDGQVYPDQFWRNYSLGNIRDRNFSDIWHDTSDPVLKKLRNKSTFAYKRCLSCKWFDYCKGNYRFLGSDADEKNWHNEPPCYLTDDEIAGGPVASMVAEEKIVLNMEIDRHELSTNKTQKAKEIRGY